MKKTVCILMCMLLAVSLVACADSGANKNADGVSETVSDKAYSESGSETASDKKTLVVYFSATGSTKKAAETIADFLNADTFEIVPEDPYTSDDLNWNNKDSRVSTEHSDESKRNISLVKSVPDNWEQYGTVYIGYPIWWGIAAWPIGEFISDNDFTGKTVIPFCTSASSGIGDSHRLLKEAAGSGNWLDGKRFSSNASEKDITEWLKKASAN